jgi:hypothetical protein
LPNPQKAFDLLRSAEKFHSEGRLPEAVAACRQALKASPNHPAVLHLLGVVLGRMGRSAESVECLQLAVRGQPESAMLRQNLGVALMNIGRLTDAEAELRTAVRLDPNLAAAQNNLGIALKDQGKYDQALELYRTAIRLKPDYADAHWNLALVLLRMGQFKEGLIEYEWRTKVRTLKPLPPLKQIRWNGQPLAGKSIVLYPEQGFGDAIQFIRYLPLIEQRGGRVVVAVAPELRRIFDRSYPSVQMVNFGSQFPAVEMECPLVSLPLAFSTDLNSIPAQIPYLKTDPALVEKWQARLGNREGKLRVGISWAGNPAHHNDRNRSMIPADLLSLAETKHATFYSLQKDKGPAKTLPPALDLIDLIPELTDFAETAAMIQNLDLVISVDTAVAHLAGAIGKSVWVLLPLVPDWRWMQDRPDTPWYPTMRLFRQRSIGDWSAVIQDVNAALREKSP